MIKLFRKIRQKLLNENKSSAYLLYAVGEIVLVVVGILIALQINNLNELSKQNQQRKTYEESLIIELKSDLYALNKLDSTSKGQLKLIDNYYSYYKNPNKDINVIIQKMDSISYISLVFNSTAYTIDDIISTGNLSLFSKEKKEAILKLKNAQEVFEKYRMEVREKRDLSNLAFENSVDLFSFYNISPLEYGNMKDWRGDLMSEQFRLFNNKIIAEGNTYSFRIYANKEIRRYTQNLLDILTKD